MEKVVPEPDVAGSGDPSREVGRRGEPVVERVGSQRREGVDHPSQGVSWEDPSREVGRQGEASKVSLLQQEFRNSHCRMKL